MTVVAAATAVCDSMHQARSGRVLRRFHAILILSSHLAPITSATSNLRGGPGHSSEKRINLSTSELCSEAPVLCAQSQSTSCGFVSPGQRGHECRGTQAPSPPLSWHFHRPPPVLCSQSSAIRHGDSYRPINDFCDAVLKRMTIFSERTRNHHVF